MSRVISFEEPTLRARALRANIPINEGRNKISIESKSTQFLRELFIKTRYEIINPGNHKFRDNIYKFPMQRVLFLRAMRFSLHAINYMRPRFIGNSNISLFLIPRDVQSKMSS